jgi:hypothetical protein
MDLATIIGIGVGLYVYYTALDGGNIGGLISGVHLL